MNKAVTEPSVPVDDGAIFEPTLSPEEYNELIKGLQLEGTAMSSCTGHLYNRQRIVENSTELDTGFGMEAGFQTSQGPEGWTLMAMHRVTFQFTWKNNPVLLLVSSFQFDYRLENEMTQEGFEIFQRLSLPLHTIPYHRELFQSMTQRMGIPPVVLPIFTPLDLFQGPDQSQEKDAE